MLCKSTLYQLMKLKTQVWWFMKELLWKQLQIKLNKRILLRNNAAKTERFHWNSLSNICLLSQVPHCQSAFITMFLLTVLVSGTKNLQKSPNRYQHLRLSFATYNSARSKVSDDSEPLREFWQFCLRLSQGSWWMIYL